MSEWSEGSNAVEPDPNRDLNHLEIEVESSQVRGDGGRWETPSRVPPTLRLYWECLLQRMLWKPYAKLTDLKKRTLSLGPSERIYSWDGWGSSAALRGGTCKLWWHLSSWLKKSGRNVFNIRILAQDLNTTRWRKIRYLYTRSYKKNYKRALKWIRYWKLSFSNKNDLGTKITCFQQNCER